MSELRRMSTRYRGEPPPKKRALSPTSPPLSSKEAPTRPVSAPSPPTPEPIEKGLPTKLREGQALPLLHERQGNDVTSKGYQSFSESGVLAASIERSRQKWTADGIFERYWSKPTKKKGINETQQPAKETMSRLGTCTMIIEPHTFDITLYTVKDMPVNYQYPAFPPPRPSYAQYTPTAPKLAYPPTHNSFPMGQAAAPPRPPQPTPNAMPNPPPPTPQPQVPQSGQTTLPSLNEGFGRLNAPNNYPAYPSSGPQMTPHFTPQPQTGQDARRQSKSSIGSQDVKPKEAASSDPVIQMLATRAASDYRLKGLMKIVAAGNASPEQLKEFQAHIDELNTLLKSPKAPDTQTNTHHPPLDQQHPGTTTSFIPNTRPPSIPPIATPVTNPAVKTEPAPQQFHQQIHPLQPHYQSFSPALPPQQMRPKSLPANRADIHSVVFDFSSGGDRFSFPRFSILDFHHGGTQVVVSFLVIRRGSAAATTARGSYKDSKNYYQPVTMRLSSQNPRTLESLARIVAPPDEVRKYMDGVFDKMIAADTVYLPMRLPKAKESEGLEVKEVEKPIESLALRAVYEPPNAIALMAA